MVMDREKGKPGDKQKWRDALNSYLTNNKKEFDRPQKFYWSFAIVRCPPSLLARHAAGTTHAREGGHVRCAPRHKALRAPLRATVAWQQLTTHAHNAAAYAF